MSQNYTPKNSQNCKFCYAYFTTLLLKSWVWRGGLVGWGFFSICPSGCTGIQAQFCFLERLTTFILKAKIKEVERVWAKATNNPTALKS